MCQRSNPFEGKCYQFTTGNCRNTIQVSLPFVPWDLTHPTHRFNAPVNNTTRGTDHLHTADVEFHLT